MSPTSLILDFETLDTAPSAVITQIGIIAVNRRDFQVFAHLKLFPHILPQLATGRTYTSDTIRWAEKKGCSPTGLGQTPLADCLKRLHRFIEDHDPYRIWAWGKDFERPLFEHASQQHHLPIPAYQFRKFSCARDHYQTAFGIQAKAPERIHQALQDCHDELRDLHQALTALGRLDAF